MRKLDERQASAQKQNRILMAGVDIYALKMALAATDYKALKFAEGELTAEEYAPVRDERRALREKINALEAEINTLKG